MELDLETLVKINKALIGHIWSEGETNADNEAYKNIQLQAFLIDELLGELVEVAKDIDSPYESIHRNAQRCRDLILIIEETLSGVLSEPKIKVYDKKNCKYLEKFLIDEEGNVYQDNGFGSLVSIKDVETEVEYE